MIKFRVMSFFIILSISNFCFAENFQFSIPKFTCSLKLADGNPFLNVPNSMIEKTISTTDSVGYIELNIGTINCSGTALLNKENKLLENYSIEIRAGETLWASKIPASDLDRKVNLGIGTQDAYAFCSCRVGL